MDVPWDSAEPDVPALIEEIVCAAVAYGYRRGLDEALASVPRPLAAASPLAREHGEQRRQRARQVAEEFLRKAYVEQLISGDTP